jgi:hypothetical protein
MLSNNSPGVKVLAGTISHYRILEKLGGGAAHLSLDEGLTIPGAPRADLVSPMTPRKLSPSSMSGRAP